MGQSSQDFNSQSKAHALYEWRAHKFAHGVSLVVLGVLAGLLDGRSAHAQEVVTKDPFDVTLGGYFDFTVGNVMDDKRYYPNARGFDFRDDARLFLDARAMADNGLKYGIMLRSDVDTQRQGTDHASQRAYLYADGDWGHLELGDTMGPAYRSFGYPNDYGPAFLDTVGPEPIPIAWDFLPGEATSGPASGWGNALNVALATLGAAPFSFQNATKILYATPPIDDIRFAVAFIPDGQSPGGQTVSRSEVAGDVASGALPVGTPIGDGELGTCLGSGAGAPQTVGLGATNGICQTTMISQQNLENAIEMALDMRKTISYWGFRIGLGYTHAEAKRQATSAAGTIGRFNDLDSFAANVGGSVAGLQVTAGATYEGDSRELAAGPYHAPSYGYGLGFEYTLGPWTLGGFGRHAEQAGSTYLPGTDRLEDEEIGVAYKVAQGVSLWTDGYHISYHDDGALLGTAAGSVDARTATVFMLGSSVSF